MISPADLGWIAGIIDYKGRLVRKNNKERATSQVTLTVRSKEPAIPATLGAFTGTTPELHTMGPLKEWMRRSCTEHCPEAHVHIGVPADPVMPDISTWTVTGAALAIVLHNLMPYLKIDRGFPAIYTEILAMHGETGRGSAAVRATIVRLELLGWELPEQYRERPATLGQLLDLMAEFRPSGVD